MWVQGLGVGLRGGYGLKGRVRVYGEGVGLMGGCVFKGRVWV